MVRGSERWLRLGFETFTETFLSRGMAVFTWDKRAARSLPLFADDALAAIRIIRGERRIEAGAIGLYGFSEGGWVVPIAAASAPDLVAFTVIASGPAVSEGEDALYDQLTGVGSCSPTGLSASEVDARMAEAGSSGFSPVSHLERMPQPGLWQYCEADLNIPPRQSIAVLQGIRAELGKDWVIQVFPDCNHNFIAGGELCELDGPRVDWASHRCSSGLRGSAYGHRHAEPRSLEPLSSLVAGPGSCG